MLFIRALLTLFAYDVLSTFCRFETIYSMVKGWTVTSAPSGQDTIDRVCKAVNYACIWYPKTGALPTALLRHYVFAQESMACLHTWCSAHRNFRSRPMPGSKSTGRQSTSDRTYRRPTPFGIAAN